ncbi:MAG: DegT/DnrJ/EryC1/StrS family aminotransferase [Candidatus Omnitrophica bacterium]|nr:DegT/DnrJ/EryC1/StrS family aminotransferase [Candidatus Omnitrophota bacterium]
MIQIFSNSLGDDEAAAVKCVLASKWLGRGKECEGFEKELSSYFGTDETLLFNCCTSAIYAMLKAHGIGAGDEVIVSTVNFVAVASAVVELGAKPVFADVDPDYFNILPSEITRLKTKKTRAVFILHYGGHPAPFDEIKAAAGRDVLILEDSANSVASKYKGVHCGALGDGGAFSFDAMKILVMGDGGALILRDPAIRAKAKALRYLGYGEGTTSGSEASKTGKLRWWEYDLECASGRFISNDIQASMGRIQLQKLPGFIARRKQIWDYYQANLKGIAGLGLPPEPLTQTSSSYYLYWIKVPGKRNELAAFLKEKGIYTTFRYFPLHLVKFYGDSSKLKNAEEMNENTLNIPVHQNLTDAEVQQIVDAVRAFFKA